MNILRSQIEYFASLPKIVKCNCGECYQEPQDILLYDCEMCRRSVPWCYGATDDNLDLCDDCADRVDPEHELAIAKLRGKSNG